MTTAKPTIVLIEDDEILAEMYAAKFAKEGITLLRASDGDEGLALLRKAKPQLVLLDIMMPKRNGLDVLKDLKADPDLRDTYVVLLTNVGEQNYIDEGFKLGAAQFLMKSNFTPREVVDKVKGWLSER